jgi:glycosyltransferase involved in cell wall biosynthesis
MAKKILIINKSFELGGVQMALNNMIEALHEEYEITLAVFNPNGPLKDRIPKGVKLLTLSPLTQVLGMSNSDCKQYGSKVQRIFKTLGSIWAKVFGNALPVNIALAMQQNVGEYDVVISYHQETSIHTLVTGFGKFALKKANAPMKIAWVHADFLATKLATNMNYRTYQQFDRIVCVSQTCMKNFITAYPSLKDKCDYCYNYVPVEEILQKASERQNVFVRGKNTIVLFSACRLVEEKGLVPALKNLLQLWKEGFDLRWYIAGEGAERENLETIIREHHLDNKVILLGFQPNPYPYFKEADYLFLPSLHETFSMVVSEAHILGTSVIASDIPVMREVLVDGDYLCKDGNYAEVIQKVKVSSGYSNKSVMQYDWKIQFERTIEK